MTCPSELSWLVCSLQFGCCVNIMAVWDEGFSLIAFATVFVWIVGRLKGGWTTFQMRVCHGWKKWFPLFCSGARRFFQATDVPALVRCHFVDTEPRRLRREAQKKN